MPLFKAIYKQKNLNSYTKDVSLHFAKKCLNVVPKPPPYKYKTRFDLNFKSNFIRSAATL